MTGICKKSLLYSLTERLVHLWGMFWVLFTTKPGCESMPSGEVPVLEVMAVKSSGNTILLRKLK